MIRAGVFIGVDQTGELHKLNDAAAGARRMYEWALKQGMADKTHAKLITDEGGAKVTPDRICDAINEVIDGPGADQLIVYYAGHGVHNMRSERWLLTDAPRNTSAAVNVAGSVEAARYCGGVQHVVIISDACRVAPAGIAAANVSGTEIFPNETVSDTATPVDQFFACGPGKAAVEVKDPKVAADNYNALYTGVLLEALDGSRPDVLEPAAEGGGQVYYVRTRRLESYLRREVPQRVRALNLQHKVNQNPDSIITSDQSWLSRLDVPVVPPGGIPRGGLPPPPAPPDTTPRGGNLRSISQEVVRSAAEGDRQTLRQQLEDAKYSPVAGADLFAETVERVEKPFGPDHFETECGFKVRGARVVEFFSPRAGVEPLGSEGDLLRVTLPLDEPCRSVLLRFDGGVGTVLPAIKGFVAALTFEEGELVDVAYEPSANTGRWNVYQARAAQVRALRAVAAAASQHGRFHLEGADPIRVAQQMQYEKAIDPTLSVYAAYAYHDLQEVGRIREMAGYQRDDLGFTLFDLALLGRELVGERVGSEAGVFPFFPLLSQGWSLLNANRVRLPRALDRIEQDMLDSLWSLFDSRGLDKLRRAMATMEVR